MYFSRKVRFRGKKKKNSCCGTLKKLLRLATSDQKALQPFPSISGRDLVEG